MSSTEKQHSMLCTDSDGLCLSATGDFSEESSGIYHNLIQMASQLTHSGEHAPVIRIETDDGSTLVKTYDSYTVAVQLPAKGVSNDAVETTTTTAVNPKVSEDDAGDPQGA